MTTGTFIAIAVVQCISGIIVAKYLYKPESGTTRLSAFFRAFSTATVSYLALWYGAFPLVAEIDAANIPHEKILALSIFLGLLTGLNAGVPDAEHWNDPNDVPEHERVSAKERVRRHIEAAKNR